MRPAWRSTCAAMIPTWCTTNFDIPTEQAGDAWARTLVRRGELLQQSVRILRQVVKKLPESAARSAHRSQPVGVEGPGRRGLRAHRIIEGRTRLVRGVRRRRETLSRTCVDRHRCTRCRCSNTW